MPSRNICRLVAHHVDPRIDRHGRYRRRSAKSRDVAKLPIGARGGLRHSNLDVTILGQAIKATFARRGTALPTSTPVGLSDEFAADQTKQTQWRAFTARNQLRAPELPVIVQHLQRFLESVIGPRT